jgi:prepilin-type processing-associated H-X9-DG protein
LVGHDLHTQNEKCLVKQSRFFGFFSLSLAAQAQYHALLTPKSMAESSPPPVERSFTLIELLVVIATITILATLAVPVFNSTLEAAKATKDMSNLRQLALALQTYLNDKDQILPASTTWPGTAAAPVLYPKYIATRKVFQSPFDKRAASEANDGTAPVSYSINDNMYAAGVGLSGNMLKVVSPASTFLMAPTYTGDPRNASSWTGTAGSAPDLPVGGTGETRGTHSNGRRINVLFCDLHTETLTFGPATTAGTFQDTISNLGLKHWDPRQ